MECELAFLLGMGTMAGCMLLLYWLIEADDEDNGPPDAPGIAV